MKIAAIGDIHAHNWKEFSTQKLVYWDSDQDTFIEVTEEQKANQPELQESTVIMNSRLLTICNALCCVREYCCSNSIPYLLVAGDLFHARGAVETSVFNAVYQVFESMQDRGIRLVFIAGNHDQVDNSVVPENSLLAFRHLGTVLSTPHLVTLTEFTGKDKKTREYVDLIAIPYSKDKAFVINRLNSLLEEQAVLEKSRQKKIATGKQPILLAHLGISGGLVGSSNYVMSDEYNLTELKIPKFLYGIFGHYHKPQTLEYNSFYTGSLVQNTFNDEGSNNGLWVIDTEVENGEQRMECVDIYKDQLHIPRFHTITSEDSLDATVVRDSRDYYRVKANVKDLERIQSELPEEITEKLKLEVEKDYESELRSGINVSQSVPEILEIYVEENYDEGMGVPKETLIVTGIELYNTAMKRG